MTKPSFGTDCPIDVDKLVESRLLIQANSGAGKSWAVRRLVEQTYGHVQQIIVDVDGEYHTLREKCDFVLAGKNGDCPADIKSAALLARRLLELNVSAIVDIYELGSQKKLFVKRFLDALVAAPRDLWHPVLIVIDEAHIFAPEAGQSESAAAVIDLMTLGRKRGFCGVLATQRISKLHKDAAAECNNKLIGRSSLDIDMKRAASELGFTTREDTNSLRTLKAGEFYAFGPALSDEVKQIKVGAVTTTHLKAGQRAMPPAPPSGKIKKVLGQLADLPHEAEEEAKTVAELKLQVKSLLNELKRTTVKTETKEIKVPIIDKASLANITKAVDKLDHWTKQMDVLRDRMAQAQQVIVTEGGNLRAFAKQQVPPPASLLTVVRDALATPVSIGGAKNRRQLTVRPSSDGALPVGEATILRALIQFPDGLRREQLGVLTTYKRSTRDAYIARLNERGFVEHNLSLVFATDDGRAAMPDAEPLPTGEALRDFWFDKLPTGESQILKVLIEAYPDSIERSAIDEVTGFKRSTRDAYLARLSAKQLVVEAARGNIIASDTLFDN